MATKIRFPKMEQKPDGTWLVRVIMDADEVGHWKWNDAAKTWDPNDNLDAVFGGKGKLAGFYRIVDAKKKARELFASVQYSRARVILSDTPIKIPATLAEMAPAPIEVVKLAKPPEKCPVVNRPVCYS